MSDWHFGMDYDMWLYPSVDWTSPDYNYELPEPIEAANIEGTLLVNAEDAIEQVCHLQAENAKLRELVRDMMGFFEDGDWCVKCERARDCQSQEQYEDDCLMRFVFRDHMRELGVLDE